MDRSFKEFYQVIRIQNIYYMLSYAFRILDSKGYKKVSAESFQNTGDLFSAILIKGIQLQIKRGLHRDYISKTDSLSTIRGKIHISQSLKTQSVLKNQLICTYDVFSENSYLNRIIKSTVMLLLRMDISKARKKELRKLMIYFADIDSLDISDINWNIRYNHNNQNYRLLINICYLVIHGLLQKQSDGTMILNDFLDEQKEYQLYERFVYEYYRKEHPELKVEKPKIEWQLDDGYDFMLPTMQTDIALSKGNEILIIDAKYYQNNLQTYYDRQTIHSHNLYQIFTYVKNKEVQYQRKPHKVSGMLLYAKTDNKIQPDHEYLMSGNKISVKTLDLNQDFTNIKNQLDYIVTETFF